MIPSRTANSIHVMKMCSAFASLGHEVVLYVPSRNKECLEDIDDVYDFYGVDKTFSIKRVYRPASSLGVYLFGFLAALFAVVNRSNLIYTRDLTVPLILALLGRPVFFESHSPADNSSLKRALINRIFKRKSLRKLVVITESLKNYYETRFPFLLGRIVVAPDGADPLPEGVEKKQLQVHAGRLQVGYTGHLYPGKGMEVIAALAPMAEWADFHVVGGTPADIQAWKERVQEADNIIFHGFQPHSSIPGFLCAFDVLLLPNQRQVAIHGHGGQRVQEDIAPWTSPLKAFEYMSTGKPILVSDMPVLKEIFDHGQNALLCDPELPEDWHNKLQAIQSDRALRRELGAEAYRRFMERYTWKSRAKMISGLVCER